jgi:hypothetical protein
VRFPFILGLVNRLPRALLLAIALTAGCASVRLAAQAPSAPPAAAAVSNIFTGTITELKTESITVVRRVTGQAAVTRSFVRDAQTTVEGRLRLKSRVTIRFRMLDDGSFAAVHIIVR